MDNIIKTDLMQLNRKELFAVWYKYRQILFEKRLTGKDCSEEQEMFSIVNDIYLDRMHGGRYVAHTA